MRLSTASSATVLAMIVPNALCDFSLYAAGVGGNGISGNSNGWQVYPKTNGVIKCSDALEWIWGDSDDVSGGKYGVRCDGADHSCARSASGKGIEELEINARQSSKDTDPHFSKSLPKSSVSLIDHPLEVKLTGISSILRQSRRSDRGSQRQETRHMQDRA